MEDQKEHQLVTKLHAILDPFLLRSPFPAQPFVAQLPLAPPRPALPRPAPPLLLGTMPDVPSMHPLHALASRTCHDDD